MSFVFATSCDKKGDERACAFLVVIAYKYCKPELIEKVLEDGMVRFTQPAEFNDPFEASPSFSGNRPELDETLLAQYLMVSEPCSDQERSQRVADGRKLLPSLRQDFALDYPAKLSELFVVLCLSQSRKNLLMWAHYTDCHRGFVVGFDTNNKFFQRGAFGGLREVTYAKTRGRVPQKGGWYATPEELKIYNNNVFFTKSCDWAYEEELRIVRSAPEADCVPGTSNGWDICLFQFPLEAVREVVVGARMTKGNRARIIEVCENKYRHAHILRASLDPEQFAMEVAEQTRVDANKPNAGNDP